MRTGDQPRSGGGSSPGGAVVRWVGGAGRGAKHADRGHLARLKAVVRAELGLTADAVVVVSELRCGDRDCAPVETLVAVLVDGARRVWRLPVPVDQVVPQQLCDTITRRPDGGQP